MRPLLFVVSLLAAFFAHTAAARTVLIDWSSASAISNPASDGKHWNSLGSGSSDLAATTLVDSTGAATASSVAVDVTVNGSNNGSAFGGSAINGPAGADPFDEAGAVIDGIYANNNSVGTSLITLSDLAASTEYNLSSIGGRASNGGNGLITVIQGSSGSGSYTLPNNGTVLNFSVTSTAAGVIQLNYSESSNDTNAGTNSTWNALSFAPAVVDTDPPALAGSDIVDDQNGSPVESGTRVTYTVTFSEDINGSTVSSSDFDNAGSSAISFGTIAEISAGVFTVDVTPTSTGELRLRVPTTATIEDLAGNLLLSDPAILDDTTITVTDDSTPPTLAASDIIDDRAGSPVPVNSPVTYTLTFSKAIDAGTVNAADFANNGTSAMTVGTISETSAGVFTVEIIPTTLGTLQLRIAEGATITDLTGLALTTSPAIVGDTTITVRERRPNIVVFLVDDMGVHDTSVPFLLDGSGQPVSYNFNNFYQTPNMEMLASQGMRFTTAYAQTVCSPTRVGLLTGRTSARHGVTDWVGANDPGSPTNWRINGITESEPTLPKQLQAAGYRTIHVGKGHLAKSPVDINNLGFDVNIAGSEHGEPGSYTGSYGQGTSRPVPHLEAYHNTGTFLTKALTLEANAAIGNAVNSNMPFFLHMSFYALHTPFTTNPDATGDYSAAVNGDHAKYATMVEGMDIAIGEIRQKLIDLGIAEDTLIVFLGDNGTDSPATSADTLPSGTFNDWPMRGKKASKWEGGARVPLIATWAVPDASNPLQQALPIPANSIETDIVTTWDIPATLLDFVGLPVPAAFGEDSHSLLPYLAGAAGTHRPQEIVVHYPHEHRSDFFSWIRQGDMKLIYNFQPNTHELYNLTTDPTESTNLAASQPATTMALTRRLAQMLDDEWGPAGVMLPTISSSAPAGNVVSIPNNAGIDLDNDGIDDRDEDPDLNGIVDHGETDPDNDNSDNDNITDGGELQIGTDPLDPNSFFYLTGDLQANGSILLTWPSQPGTSFEIQSSTDLSDWSTLIEANHPADDPGSSTSYTTPASAEPREFYRIGLK